MVTVLVTHFLPKAKSTLYEKVRDNRMQQEVEQHCRENQNLLKQISLPSSSIMLQLANNSVLIFFFFFIYKAAILHGCSKHEMRTDNVCKPPQFLSRNACHHYYYSTNAACSGKPGIFNMCTKTPACQSDCTCCWKCQVPKSMLAFYYNNRQRFVVVVIHILLYSYFQIKRTAIISFSSNFYSTFVKCDLILNKRKKEGNLEDLILSQLLVSVSKCFILLFHYSHY